MEYLVAFILTAAGIIINKKMTPGPRKVYLGVICIYLIILVGLRYKVGVDTISYTDTFKHIKPLDRIFQEGLFSYRYEPGYLLLSSLVKTFTKEFFVMQLIVAAIVNGCIFTFLYRYCKNVFVGVMFFLFLQWFYFSMEIMRESVAISIFLLNYRNLEKKNWVAYYLVSLLCMSFHYSAAITWFFPFARFLKPNWSFIVFCIIAVAFTPIFDYLANTLSFLSFDYRIAYYLSNADDLNLNWKLAELFRAGCPAIATVVLYRYIKKNMPLQNMVLLQILFCFGAFAIPIVFSRFANYTTLFVTVAIANFICSEKATRSLKTLLICFIIMTQGFYYYSMYPRWFPYVSVFNPKMIHEREQIWKHDFITW